MVNPDLPDRVEKIIRDGLHVGLDFYDLLLEEGDYVNSDGSGIADHPERTVKNRMPSIVEVEWNLYQPGSLSSLVSRLNSG
jgi:hypothetical protein